MASKVRNEAFVVGRMKMVLLLKPDENIMVLKEKELELVPKDTLIVLKLGKKESVNQLLLLPELQLLLELRKLPRLLQP